MKKTVADAFRRLSFSLKDTPLVLRYGIVLAAGLILLKTLEYQLFSYRFSMELYTGLLAVFFMLVGLAAGLGWLRGSPGAMQDEQRAELLEPLTFKEKKILHGLSAGLTNQQLADQQHVSVNTVKSHLKNIYKKLDVKTRTQAVTLAKQLNIIDG